MKGSIQGTAPERMHARAELRRLMESALAALPETFRLVFVLREIEEQSVEDVAAMLDLNPATVKTRHRRARPRPRAALAPAVHANRQSSDSGNRGRGGVVLAGCRPIQQQTQTKL